MSYHGPGQANTHYLGVQRRASAFGDVRAPDVVVARPPVPVTHTLGRAPAALSYALSGGLGSDANKTALKIAQGKSVTVLEKLNMDVANMLAPMKPAIMGMPGVSTADKQKLLGAPLNFLLDIFDPIEDMVGRASDRVMQQKGFTQKPFWLLGKSVNIARVQKGDNNLDATTRNIVKRLRTINAFVVLCYTQPLEIAGEMLQEGLNIGKAIGLGSAELVHMDVSRKGQYSGAYPGAMNGLGEPTTASVGIIAGITAALGPELSAVLVGAIGVLVTALGGALASVVTSGGDAAAAAIAPKPVTPTMAVTRPTLTSTVTSGGGLRKIGPVGPSTTTTPGTAPPVNQAAGIPPVAVFAGAAVLAFLVLRRKG